MVTSDLHAFTNSSVLVTGGAGFVGGNLVRKLLLLGVSKIRIVDNLLSSEKINIPDDSRIMFTQGSIADDGVLSDIRNEFDYVFHLSTYHGNQSSIHNPLEDHQNNLLTTLKLFEHIKSFGRLKKMVYSGAGCAVAEKTFESAHATSEDAPISLEMDSPYSISKIVGEFYAVYYFNRHRLPIVRARFQNVYGPGEILGAGQWRGTPATVWRNVVPTFIYKSIKGFALPVEGGGVAGRDFIYVDDIVNGLLACVEKGQAGDVYNLASGVETSILDLANTINNLTGNQTPLQMLPARDWDHSGRRFGNPEKSFRELGFCAQVSIQTGLQRTVEWTRQRLPDIEACIEKHSIHMNRY